MSPDPARPGELREDDHYTTALYRAAIGPVNRAYYLALFTQRDLEHQLETRWNWAAALATLDWLIFRKMGLHALAYGGAMAASVLLVLGLGTAWLGFSSFVVWALAAGIGLISVLVPGLLGNRWFHAACSRQMTLALQTHADVAQACDALGREASQRRRGIAIAVVHMAILLTLGLVVAQFAAFSQRAGAGTNAVLASTSPQMASGRVVQAARIPAPAPVSSAASPQASEPRAVVAVAASSPAAKTPALAAKASAGYFLNVGLFAVASNAQAAKEKLEAQKLPVIADTLSMSQGPRIRVRCGPFDTKEQAQAAATKIRALGLDAVFVGPK